MIILGHYNSSHLLRYRWVYIRPLSGPRHFRLYSPPRRHTSCRCPRSRHFRSYNQTRTPCSSVGGKKKCTMCLYLIKQYQMLTIADEYHIPWDSECVYYNFELSTLFKLLYWNKTGIYYSPLLWHNIIQVKKNKGLSTRLNISLINYLRKRKKHCHSLLPNYHFLLFVKKKKTYFHACILKTFVFFNLAKSRPCDLFLMSSGRGILRD